MNRVKRQVPASFRAVRKDTSREGCRSGTWDYFLGMEQWMWGGGKPFECRDTRQLAGAHSVSGIYKCEAKDGTAYGSLQRQMRRLLRNGEESYRKRIMPR